MQRTLLQVVQSYLNRSSGFYVNSIFDTDESQQAAQIAEEVYYQLTHRYPNLLYSQKLTQLDSYGDLTRPNYLKIPESILRIQESKLGYNVAEDEATVDYREVVYKTPLEFVEIMNARTDKNATNVVVVEGVDGTKMAVLNNKWPDYFTTFDGKTIVFDSYNSEYDDTVQASKSQVLATEEPVFLIEDEFLIPIPERLSETYLDNVINECYAMLREEVNPLINQRARAGVIRMQQDSRQLGSGGRPKKKYGRSSPAYDYDKTTRGNY
jgi:hypothetical protein